MNTNKWASNNHNIDLKRLREILKDGYTQAALKALFALNPSLLDHVEHIDYSDCELPA